jgi:ribonuclease P protein component
MLKKKQRLSRDNFTQLLKKGKRLHDTDVSLVFMPTLETKCGVVVSKKTAKHATARNLVRRRIFAILGENLENLSHLHVAVVTKKSVVHIPYSELKEILNNLIHKINTIAK